MNKSTFVRFGIFVALLRCTMAVIVIIKTVPAIVMINRLISPIRDWMSDVALYSIFASLLVLLITVVDSTDYMEKNIDQFRKIGLLKQNLKLKSFIITTIIESITLIGYCIILQYTLELISKKLEDILNTGLINYATNTTWQVFWDTFQQHYHCCGNSQSTDWFKSTWISPIISSVIQLKKYKQENGKFVVPAAPISCCIPNTICNTFVDCIHPDTNKYYGKGCSLVIADTLNSVLFTIYIFYAVLIIQFMSAIVKYEGYTDKEDNLISKE